MKTKPEKRDGFYMKITPEDRGIINMLQGEFAINISQAFKLFLRTMLEKQKETNK